MRAMRPPVVLALIVVAIGCGGGDSHPGRPATGISNEDAELVERIRADVRAWNRAATPWVRAFSGNDLQRFLAVHRRSLKPLHAAASGIEFGALQIAEPALRRRLVRIADGYRAEYNLITDIGDYAAGGQFGASRRATRQLRRVTRRKGEQAERLADDYPELGREF